MCIRLSVRLWSVRALIFDLFYGSAQNFQGKIISLQVIWACDLYPSALRFRPNPRIGICSKSFSSQGGGSCHTFSETKDEAKNDGSRILIFGLRPKKTGRSWPGAEQNFGILEFWNFSFKGPFLKLGASEFLFYAFSYLTHPECPLV